MSTLELHVAEIVDDAAPLRLTDLLEYTHVERTLLVEMVDAGVLSPNGESVEQWQFVRRDLQRLRTAQRLINDFDINVTAVALVLDLLEERQELTRRLHLLSRVAEDKP